MTITKTITTKANHYFRALVALAVLTMLAGLLAASAASPAYATKVFFVNSTTDEADFDLTDGRCDVEPPTSPLTRCTLRAAIQEANKTAGADTIAFNVPGTGVQTIRPSSALPSITDPLTIDGYSQGAFTPDPSDNARPNTLARGTNAKLKIELDGSNAGNPAAGFFIETSDSVVEGLVINRFTSAGIVVAGPRNSVVGNFVGTDPSGTKALGNGFAGVDVEGIVGEEEASNNFVGGPSPEERNLISGNSGFGVSFLNELAPDNDVQGNLIGTQRDGIKPLGNGGAGVGIFGPQFIAVGDDTPERANTIAFNGKGGVVIGNSGSLNTTSNRVVRNSIFSNVGPGIDLGFDGPTANDTGDADTGPNTLLNKPLISSAKTVSGKTTIKGKLNSHPNQRFLVQFFSNPAGENEGKKFMAEKEVTTDASGNATFTLSPSSKVAVGRTITATALDFGQLNTSEFSAPRKVVAS